MYDDETIETYTSADGNYRARVVHDDDACHEPEHDYAAPLIRADMNHYGRPEFEMTGYGRESWAEDGLSQDAAVILRRLCHDEMGNYVRDIDEAVTIFDRYLRAFHGGKAEVVITPGRYSTDHHYVSYVTERMATRCWGRDAGEALTEDLQEGASEYRAWIDGESYGIISENRVKTVTTKYDATGELIETIEDDDEWDVDESVWGYHDPHIWSEEKSWTLQEAKSWVTGYDNRQKGEAA